MTVAEKLKFGVIADNACKEYSKIAIYIATQNPTFSEFIANLYKETSSVHFEENRVEFSMNGIRTTVANDKGQVILSSMFDVELENGQWTEFGYNTYDKEFVWMDEVVEKEEDLTHITTYDGREWKIDLKTTFVELNKELRDEILKSADRLIGSYCSRLKDHKHISHYVLYLYDGEIRTVPFMLLDTSWFVWAKD